RRHIATADLYVEGTCADGKTVTFAQPARFIDAPQPGMVVTAGDNVFFGRGLSKTGRFVADGLSVGNYGAVTAAITEHLTAKFRKGKATGTYKATMEIRDNQTQQPVTTCQTPAITWTTASAMGHVFGGLTSQGLPAVVEMN